MLHFQMGPTTVDSMPSTTIHLKLLFLATHMLEKQLPIESLSGRYFHPHYTFNMFYVRVGWCMLAN